MVPKNNTPSVLLPKMILHGFLVWDQWCLQWRVCITLTWKDY